MRNLFASSRISREQEQLIVKGKEDDQTKKDEKFVTATTGDAHILNAAVCCTNLNQKCAEKKTKGILRRFFSALTKRKGIKGAGGQGQRRREC